MAKKPANSVDGEHIFPASQLTPKAILWKQLVEAGRHKEAMPVLEEIVIGVTDMLQRLAQYENFHHTVDLPILVSAAQEKVIKWLMAWQPSKGKLFSWCSKCAKNAFRSELLKVNQYRKRYHVTSDNLDLFYGVEDHEVDKTDAANDAYAKIQEITCRWGDPQEIGAIRYLINCIVEDDGHNKNAAILGASYAYCIDKDLARFFYQWALVALRHSFYDKVYVPFTEQDVVRAVESYSLHPEFIDIIGYKAYVELCTKMPGARIKLHTVQDLHRMHENYKLTQDIMQSDMDPNSVQEVAKKYKKTSRGAQEIFNEMVEQLDPRRYGEHNVFGDETH